MCTLEKRGNIFFLTLTGDDEPRLNPTLIGSLRSALREAREQSTRGSALITTARGKFFSNGFDLAWAQSGGSPSAARDRLHHMVVLFRPLVADLISLPMPTIAAVTGHAAAAGMLLAVSHDYVLMRSDRGVLYMSELDIGMTLPENAMAVMRSKVGSAAARRDLLLKASKVRAAEAVAMGIVDSAHDSAEGVVEAAVRLGEELTKKKWDGEVYGERVMIYRPFFPTPFDPLSLSLVHLSYTSHHLSCTSNHPLTHGKGVRGAPKGGLKYYPWGNKEITISRATWHPRIG